jgi:hypothetical protein
MYKIKIAIIILLVLFICFAAMTYAANKKVERQKYRTIKTMDDIEIRYYPKAIMATVSTKGDSYMGNSSNNFRRLAGYIFGGNQSSQNIAMTAPVHIEKDSTESRMSFVMPADYDMDKLPVPADGSVALHYSKEGYYAAIKFGGFSNEEKILRNKEKLKEALTTLGYKTQGAYTYLGYNAPWDVVGRENEIIVEIAYTE